MASYQLNCVSDHRIFRCEEFDAADDEQAIRKALDLRGVTAAELWCGGRRVTCFEQMVRQPA
jgi:hypothetical protein